MRGLALGSGAGAEESLGKLVSRTHLGSAAGKGFHYEHIKSVKSAEMIPTFFRI